MKRTAVLGVAAALTITAFGFAAVSATAVAVGPNGGPSASRQVPAFSGLTVDPVGPGVFKLSWQGNGNARVFASTSVDDPSVSGKQVAKTTLRSAKVDGLDPLDRWYFEVARGSGASAIASTRQFVLQGAQNARDIGGYTTTDGRAVAWGKVFRSDGLSKLTADDVRALATASVHTVVDYRGAGEIARDGPGKLPSTTELVHIPVLDDNTQALATALVAALQNGDPVVLQELLGDGKATRMGDEGFIKQLQQPETMAGYGKTMQLIADRKGALLYHCTSGKDRTGMMTALLLGVLGVPVQTIVDDFVLSNTFNHEHNEQIYAYLRSKGIDAELIRPLMEQRASEIQPVLDAVEKNYGGWDAFAEKVLKLSPDTITKLRNRLLM